MVAYKKYTKKQYNSGTTKMSLLQNERRLIIKALIKANWILKDAFKLNFPVEYISCNGYNWLVLRHHINVSDKSFKKLSEID